MKKIIILFLAMSMLIICLTGCKAEDVPNEPVTITVAVDLQNADDVELMEKYAELKYPYINVELLVLDYDEEDMSKRNGQIASIRADIMAGEGPDAFILSAPTPHREFSDSGAEVEYEKLFGDPEKIMRNQVLLPLDEYIAESEVFSMEDHVETVMAAGKYEGCQYILPLTYTYDLFLYDSALIGDANFETWDDIVGFENKGLAKSLKARSFTWVASRFTDIADYENYTVSFSEEELRAELAVITDMDDKSAFAFSVLNLDSELSYMTLDEWTSFGDTAAAVPILNKENGITAYIDHYAAVNANSKNPEAAYKFIELFLSPEVQAEKDLPYEDGGETHYLSYLLRPDGMNYLTGCGIATGKVIYEDYPMLESMNERINHVRFNTPVDKLLNELVFEYMFNPKEELIAAYYNEMQMEMAE